MGGIGNPPEKAAQAVPARVGRKCSLTLRHFLLCFMEVIRVIGLPVLGLSLPPEIPTAVKKLRRL